MPELPEVEVLRTDLEREVVGRTVKSVEVRSPRSVRRHARPDAFVEALTGRTLAAARRRGKYLLVHLDDGGVLVTHLGMSGQLLLAKSARETTPKHTHVVLTFTRGGQLRFVDPRTFGEMFVSTGRAAPGVEELAHLGVDPLATALSWDYFGELLGRRRAKLKPLLMDQTFLAGIGNIYSDEILWEAGLRWDRRSNELTPQEVRRLYRAVSEVLNEAVKHRGSSLADEQYLDLYGRSGEAQKLHRAYAREGEMCSRCRGTIARVKVGGRSTFYCEGCQV